MKQVGKVAGAIGAAYILLSIVFAIVGWIDVYSMIADICFGTCMSLFYTFTKVLSITAILPDEEAFKRNNIHWCISGMIATFVCGLAILFIKHLIYNN